jgi:tetratricopeptide (TPR) repeat protein
MKKKRVLLFIFVLCMLLPSTPVFAEHTQEDNYIYDYWGDTPRSLPAFELMDTIDQGNLGQIKMGSIDDVFVSKDKRIFLVDTTESRINIFNADLELIQSIKLLRDESNKIIVDATTNKQLMLDKPEGVFYHEYSNELYIADTGAGRIIVLDGFNYHLKRIINQPENMVGVTLFKPSKIVVDKDGKISVVVQGSYEGIIEIHNNGQFSRYFGLNKPRVNLVDHFWKTLATSEQKEKMKKVFAPAFNNLSVDAEGMIYATTFDASAKDQVFRFNSKGENVLMENGYFWVVGDVVRLTMNDRSQFVDIAVSDYGVYALLDKNKGRIFIYNFQGDLLNIFGSMGYLKGDVREPTAITWFDDKLIVTDKQFAIAHVYQPTEFGEAALYAEKQYYYGQWEEAGESYAKTIELNSNYDIAYTGVGRNYLMQDEYEKAMYYAKQGNARNYYSKAFAGYRNIFIQNNFIWIVVPFLLLAGYLIYSEYRYNRKNG